MTQKVPNQSKSHEKDERALIERSDVPSHGQSMPNTPNLNGFRRTSPKSESETTRTRDSYENEKLKERIKMLENDQKQQNKENQILNLENKRLREENKRILDKHKVSFIILSLKTHSIWPVFHINSQYHKGLYRKSLKVPFCRNFKRNSCV